MGWLDHDKDAEVLKQLLNNVLSIGKGQQDALASGQVRAIDKHVVLSAGGNQRLQVALRKAGLARDTEALCSHRCCPHRERRGHFPLLRVATLQGKL